MQYKKIEKRQTNEVWLRIGITVLTLAGVALLARGFIKQPAKTIRAMMDATNSSATRHLPDYSGLKLDKIIRSDLTLGTGRPLTPDGKTQLKLKVWVYDPRKSDSQGLPVAGVYKDLIVILDYKKLPKCFAQGLLGMREGGKRNFLVPNFMLKDWDLPGEFPQFSNLLVEVEHITAVAK